MNNIANVSHIKVSGDHSYFLKSIHLLCRLRVNIKRTVFGVRVLTRNGNTSALDAESYVTFYDLDQRQSVDFGLPGSALAAYDIGTQAGGLSATGRQRRSSRSTG